MHYGIALVDRHGVRPVSALHRDEALGSFRDGLVPSHLGEARGRAPQGTAQPVRVFVDVLEGHRLRADVAVAQGIGFVSANRQHAVAFGFHDQPADGFAQVAGADMGLSHRRLQTAGPWCHGRARHARRRAGAW